MGACRNIPDRDDVAPPGREKQALALKTAKGVDNPYAVAWASYNGDNMGFTGESAGAKAGNDNPDEYEQETEGAPMGEEYEMDGEGLFGAPKAKKDTDEDLLDASEKLEDGEAAAGEHLASEHATPLTEPAEFGEDDDPVNSAIAAGGVHGALSDPDVLEEPVGLQDGADEDEEDEE